MTHSTSNGPLIRSAIAADGVAISRLYEEAYTPEGGTDASESYPFPQFLAPAWVSSAVSSGHVCWIVAAFGETVVGTVGAVRELGSRGDGAAELFGLVVSKPWRGQGIASRLMARLCELLAPETHFMIAEARTADPRGWLAARSVGFLPLGFEPFAHRTPAGLEPMLLLGRITGARSSSSTGPAPESLRARRLANAILGNFHLDLGGRRNPTPAQGFSTRPELEIVRDDERGRVLLEALRTSAPHLSGVVDLDRLQGEDPTGRRYLDAHFLGLLDGNSVCCLRASWDRCDQRTRILSLRTSARGVQPELLTHANRWLEQESGGGPLSIVVDVRADQPALLALLEDLGFFPTLYYPGLVIAEEGRTDVLQYTRLLRQPFDEALAYVGNLGWPEAQRAVDTVAGLAREARSQ